MTCGGSSAVPPAPFRWVAHPFAAGPRGTLAPIHGGPPPAGLRTQLAPAPGDGRSPDSPVGRPVAWMLGRAPVCGRSPRRPSLRHARVGHPPALRTHLRPGTPVDGRSHTPSSAAPWVAHPFAGGARGTLAPDTRGSPRLGFAHICRRPPGDGRSPTAPSAGRSPGCRATHPFAGGARGDRRSHKLRARRLRRTHLPPDTPGDGLCPRGQVARDELRTHLPLARSLPAATPAGGLATSRPGAGPRRPGRGASGPSPTERPARARPLGLLASRVAATNPGCIGTGGVTTPA